MQALKYFVVALAALAIVSTSAFATPVTNAVPDTTCTFGLLGCAVAGLTGFRIWLKK
jgi:hypothetical protein